MSETEEPPQEQQQEKQPLSPGQRAVVVLYVNILLLIVLRLNMTWFFHVPKLQTLDGNNTDTWRSDAIVTFKHKPPTEAFQQQATQMAQYTQGHLNTPISRRDFVLAHGFPPQWQWRPRSQSQECSCHAD